MTSWHGKAFNITGPLWASVDSPYKGLVMRKFDVFFYFGLRTVIWDAMALMWEGTFTTFEIQTWLPDFVMGINTFRISCWRHQMKTFSALLALCVGNSPVTGEFPSQRPVTRGFGVFFDLRLNKWLCKQSWGWWFVTPSRPLWRHCDVIGLVNLGRSNSLS